jgi:hypothetical protein
LEVDFIIGTQVNSTKMASNFIKTNLYQRSYTELKKSNTAYIFRYPSTRTWRMEEAVARIIATSARIRYLFSE